MCKVSYVHVWLLVSLYIFFLQTLPMFLYLDYSRYFSKPWGCYVCMCVCNYIKFYECVEAVCVCLYACRCV